MPFFTENPRLFKLLDRLFWLVWIAFPIVIWQNYTAVLDQSALMAEMPPEASNCAALVPQVANFSGNGKAQVLAYFLTQYVVYAWLLYLAHSAIHRCATGQVFVSGTLKTLKLLGIIIVAWPFFDLAASNLLNYALTLTGDLKQYSPNLLFDVGPFGVGLLILTMRAVLGHAILLKQDHDLTI
jgi:Protein of unknown function (DUF2975)